MLSLILYPHNYEIARHTVLDTVSHDRMSSFQNLAIADQVRKDDGLVALRQTQLFTPGFPDLRSENDIKLAGLHQAQLSCPFYYFISITKSVYRGLVGGNSLKLGFGNKHNSIQVSAPDL